MNYRAATEEDIPRIVELLRISLGESKMPKSEAFWRWKHIDNPFGKSPVLLAEEGDRLAGVRAFMRWEWKRGTEVYRSVRAVDTATHPELQGRGIFTGLTSQLVEQCAKEGVHFIFNTPNKKSKGGYLKLGWKSNGRLKINVRFRILPGRKSKAFEERYRASTMTFNTRFASDPQSLVSVSSTKLLDWRYSANPNISYFSFSDDSRSPTFLTVFRLKQHSWGLEFRICDEYVSPDANQDAYQSRLRSVVAESGANLVTSVGELSFPSITAALGPEVTVRPLLINQNELSFSNWKPSIGDLELF